MKRKKRLLGRILTGATLTAIVLSSCNNEKGDWDGTDYYTGKDTVINSQVYHHSGMGYWYYNNGGRVYRYYPNTGHTAILPTEQHTTGSFLNSSEHVVNGGAHESPSIFTGSRGGGFGSTSRGSGFHIYS